ncbi:Wzz/FepE/Etk N-terminal domain-containing protein [Craterilacuibacter sp. RT1T]|uniref:Wzz/FepE/Etk N-terminal domain-containing protein n=1 Tax=Craterilacuibacter sp. RT1T TaxID=2942211 RepID=UPI0020C15211|nr:Wzz/FepE/Etk N-terminal domain-containing protein [Craterilacuibacter sp. RT1T]MCL6263654.1 Wzz/FepE/Etk N-terminal domain-containing protein [Craterilacuibacter sp. RT1T]
MTNMQNEMNQPMTHEQDDEIDLLELLKTLWQGKWLIIASTLLSAAIAVAVALNMPNIYQSKVLLAPADAGSAGGLSAMAAQMGGLASLAGISLGGGSADKSDIAIEIGKSRQFVTGFIRSHQLEVPLMAATKWDKQSGQLVIDSNLYDVQQKKWVREVKEGASVEPTDWELYKAFSELMALDKDKKSGLATLSIDFYSPLLTKQWADWFVHDLNQAVRERDQVEARKNIDYLHKQQAQTALASMQTVFSQLVEQQTKTLMLAEVQQEYAFKTIDPAVVPEEKLKPKRALIVALGTLAGGFIGILLVLVRSQLRQRKQAQA